MGQYWGPVMSDEDHDDAEYFVGPHRKYKGPRHNAAALITSSNPTGLIRP
jgi:hypothetical protein